MYGVILLLSEDRNLQRISTVKNVILSHIDVINKIKPVEWQKKHGTGNGMIKVN